MKEPSRRVLLLALAAALASAVGCDGNEKKPGSTGGGRSEVVIATGAVATSAPSATAAHAEAPAAPRVLCGNGEMDKPGRALPRGLLAHAEAPGAVPLDGKLPAVNDRVRWSWVNFFAAWCGPCKEEIPRLRAWEQRLAQAGTPIHLVFVSMDDDERQLLGFLGEQPANGIKSALWLKTPLRETWLSGLRMKNPPQLPAHLLVDRTSKVRCIVDGAVEDQDYTQVAALIGRK